MKDGKMPVFTGMNGKNQPMKAYNMTILDDDSAEINMYGDVVATVPRDWRNDEPLPGYIGLDEFLKDLDEIKDKNFITVHINSGGGDLYAGLAIYNRLKAVKGTVTTINDGLAASAASLIFQAGNIRKMNAGSNIMAHGVAGFLFGYYNIDDLKEMVTQFKAHNKAIVNVYAEAMGVNYDEAKGFIDGETWLTGQEAVDKGLADEVIGSDDGEGNGEDGLFDRFVKRFRVAYGTPTAPNVPGQMPVNSIVSPAAPAPVDDKNKNERSNPMEIKNIEELRASYPDLLAQAETAAREEGRNVGITEERARIQEIEGIQNAIADQALINAAKYGEKPLTAEQLAFQAMQAQAAIGAAVLANMAKDSEESNTEAVPAAPNNGPETQADDPVDTDKEIADTMNLFNKLIGGKK